MSKTSDASCHIQWKGTDLCMDLRCPCGTNSHIDDDFVYYIRCPGCGAVYELGTSVALTKIPEEAAAMPPKESVDHWTHE